MGNLRSLALDLKKRARKLQNLYSLRHLLTLGAIVFGVGIVISLLPDDATATRTDPAAVLEPAAGMDLMVIDNNVLDAPDDTGLSADEAIAADTQTADALDDNWLKEAVRQGDNLSLIFGRHGVSARDLDQIMALGGDTRALKKIFPGTEIRLQIGTDGRLNALAYPIGEARELRVERTDDGFTATTIEHEIERRTATASGTIADSLFLSANRAGLSDNLIMELAGIFGYDIDFSLDIRENDRFSVIYEELYLHGEKLRDGRILAAEFVNRGKTYRAVRYVDAQGNGDYYSPDGNSLRKAFLRSPVAFTRVSSRFSLARHHPILNTIRAHKGVDYAAPTGTPVKATGDGKVIFKGPNGGYGNTVVIQHGSRYSTLYGHLSAFGRISQGQRVSQGQVIGYVGMTGLATGPHLHYEFRIDGVHRDPLTVKLPNAGPLAQRYMDDFQNQAQPLLAQLDTMGPMQASAADTGPTADTVALGAGR
jgi:murein DD-endopeptidase MepM/ murein hydrolase activator NlpD